jgi:hypothetical protein
MAESDPFNLAVMVHLSAFKPFWDWLKAGSEKKDYKEE